MKKTVHWKILLKEELDKLTKAKDPAPDIVRRIRFIRKRLGFGRAMNPKGHNQQTRKTHCPSGHPYTKKNTYIMKNGHRMCWACKIERQKKARKDLARLTKRLKAAKKERQLQADMED